MYSNQMRHICKVPWWEQLHSVQLTGRDGVWGVECSWQYYEDGSWEQKPETERLDGKALSPC